MSRLSYEQLWSYSALLKYINFVSRNDVTCRQNKFRFRYDIETNAH